MKINKHFHIRIMKRFLSEVELEEFQERYEEAKKLAIADKTLESCRCNKETRTYCAKHLEEMYGFKNDKLGEVIGYDKSKLDKLTLNQPDQ